MGDFHRAKGVNQEGAFRNFFTVGWWEKVFPTVCFLRGRYTRAASLQRDNLKRAAFHPHSYLLQPAGVYVENTLHTHPRPFLCHPPSFLEMGKWSGVLLNINWQTEGRWRQSSKAHFIRCRRGELREVFAYLIKRRLSPPESAGR